jgi:hypothetical protein
LILSAARVLLSRRRLMPPAGLPAFAPGASAVPVRRMVWRKDEGPLMPLTNDELRAAAAQLAPLAQTVNQLSRKLDAFCDLLFAGGSVGTDGAKALREAMGDYVIALGNLFATAQRLQALLWASTPDAPDDGKDAHAV